MSEYLETVVSMRDTYKKQVARLKAEWKSGNSEHCEKTYKIQLNIWERRIVEYEEILAES